MISKPPLTLVDIDDSNIASTSKRTGLMPHTQPHTQVVALGGNPSIAALIDDITSYKTLSDGAAVGKRV